MIFRDCIIFELCTGFNLIRKIADFPDEYNI